MNDVRIRGLRPRDTDAVVDLWRTAGLLVPHNDPYEDIAFCLASGHGALLAAYDGPTVIGVVQVGHDGHRGWIYGLAVSEARQGTGLGRHLVESAEAWMTARGVPKAQLIVREHNTSVAGFYEKLGYDKEPRLQMGKRLTKTDANGHASLETRVTHLEMRERPTRPTVQPPSNTRVSILRAETPAIAFYRFLYDTIGGPWTWIERRLLDDTALTTIVHDPAVEVYVLYADGTPAGLGEIDRRSADGNVELAYFGLMPERIGRGLGWYFLCAVVDLAWDPAQTERLWVHTCDLDHPRALGTYQRAGFVPFDQTMQTLPDPRSVGLPWPERREAVTPVPSTGKRGEIYLAASGNHTVVPIPLKDPQ